MKSKEDIEHERNTRILWKRAVGDDSPFWWCERCKVGFMKRFPSKDYGESDVCVWQCFKCDRCGAEKYDPFD